MAPHKDVKDIEAAKAEIAAVDYVPNSPEEKKLLWQLDIRIVPTIFVLYVLSYLDRANIGNAREAGMGDDLNLSSTQYSVVLLIFFVSYVIFEIPSNMFLSRLRPSLFLSGLCVLWGAVAACMGAVNNFGQLTAVRFCLGVLEAGFAPGVAFYFSSWYKRHEIAKRFAIYYTATAISGAFSGLLAGVISDNLHMARGIEGWRWLLIIEGAVTSFVGCFTWLFLPDWPSTTKFLTEEQRRLASARLLSEDIADTGAEGSAQPTHLQALKETFMDWRTWALSVMYMLCTGSQTIQYFIPSLVRQLGYSGVSVQYMTIPVYAVALIFILTFCFIADYTRERATWLSICTGLACVSFIIIVSVDNLKAKYAFLCFGVGGIYAACPLTLLWAPYVITHPAEKRAVAIAIVNSLGNLSSIYGSFMWPDSTAPRFVQGFTITAVFLFLHCVLAQVAKYYFNKYPYKALSGKDQKNLEPTQ